MHFYTLIYEFYMNSVEKITNFTALTLFKSNIPFLDDNNSDTNLRVSKLSDFSVRLPSKNASDSGLSIVT